MNTPIFDRSVGEFFVLQSVVSVALSPRRTASRTGILELELVLGVVWGLLSIIIIAWHRRLRASTTNLLGLMAAHLPLVLMAPVIDCAVARVALREFAHQTQLTPFWAMLVATPTSTSRVT